MVKETVEKSDIAYPEKKSYKDLKSNRKWEKRNA